MRPARVLYGMLGSEFRKPNNQLQGPLPEVEPACEVEVVGHNSRDVEQLPDGPEVLSQIGQCRRAFLDTERARNGLWDIPGGC